jgi:hypothetical protein|tara:strand:+ start:169 stop:609 length:441 start_codon:yes stop_codon:yes gene_type:complete
MKRFTIIFIILIFCISCSGTKTDARIALENYLLNLQNEDFNLAYQSLTPELQNECDYDSYKLRAKKNYEIINHSRVLYKSESKLNNKGVVKLDFIIKVDDREVDLFDMEMMDAYADEESASFVMIDGTFKLNNLIWPVDWCTEPGS